MVEAPTMDINHLRQWIGKSEETVDHVTPRLVKTLRATLFMEPGVPKVGDIAPATTHWCFVLDIVAASEVGPDGHPRRGGFLPPVALPRRMWAGGKTDHVDDIRVGDEIHKHSVITDVAMKTGRTGLLCFVTVDHTISTARGVAIRERQDIVYREAAVPSKEATAPAKLSPRPVPTPEHQAALFADPVLLFRYSGILFNGHRIHYDRPYATDVEGYRGLVVHGPLQAALLAEMAAKIRGRRVDTFVHRGVSPLCDGPFTLNANAVKGGLDLWTAGPDGVVAMKANAIWS